MNKIDFSQPDFYFCEIPIKDGSHNDHRTWVYSRKSISLIEFIQVNEFKDFDFQGTQEVFLYGDEEWIGVFVQNNCAVFEIDALKILRDAWQYFSDYLSWEDNNIENETF